MAVNNLHCTTLLVTWYNLVSYTVFPIIILKTNNYKGFQEENLLNS